MIASGELTEIKPTKKGRYALFCAGEFVFSVDEETLLRHHLKVGMQLSGEQWMQLRAASDYERAKNRAFTYLAMRDHSERELYDKLKLHFDPHTAAATVQRLKELELLDDDAFAEKLAAELARKGKSRAEARIKLQEKGIDRERAAALLDEYYTDESQQETIRNLLQGQYRSRLARADGVRLVTAALLRRGFRAADIRAALQNCGAEQEEPDCYE